MSDGNHVNWTNDQLDAINSRGGTLLVSAAAGSGKTAVLVERLIRMLTDVDNPCPITDVLVVTFTNAAAANMKTKIAAEIEKKIKLNPQNTFLRTQQTMLPLARISTIDSFCIGLVRDNFHQLDGVTPDFILIDESRLAVLKNEAITSTLEEFYRNNPIGFSDLCNLICDAKDDKKLSDAVLKIYDICQAYPFPDKRLDALADAYRNPQPFHETIWGKYIYGYIGKGLDYCAALMEKAVAFCGDDSKFGEKLTPLCKAELQNYIEIRNQLDNIKWDELTHILKLTEFDKFPSIQKYRTEDKEKIKEWRDTAKKVFKEKICDAFLIESQQDIYDDIATLLPAIECLVDMVKTFSTKYSDLKRSENGADFNDTLHFAIQLLSEEDENGSIIPSETAKELSQSFREIFVDEYQDVNEAQEILFRLLSRNSSNLFMVGDVKQSIYGFRQAMPELFLMKQNEYRPIAEKTYPAKVILGKNFRSRKGVTENINHIFRRIMTAGVGGLEYNEEHTLHYDEGGYDDHKTPDAEIHLIETEEKDASAVEAKYIADYIEKNVGVLQVKHKLGMQPAGYGDFCVLMRSLSGEAELLMQELESRSIPVVCDTDYGFFNAPEVMFMTSLLKIVSNPVDDVALLAVMMSPVYGFSADELARIRAARRKGNIYYSVVNAANNGNKKCTAFLEEIARFRRIAFTSGTSQFIRCLLEETGYSAIVSAMKESSVRRSNLNLLVDYAISYESTGRSGLSGFLRYIERAVESEAKISSSVNVSENTGAVRIMTIHKSKGLEFPVTILARCSKNFNTSGQNENIIVSRECGLGMRSGGKNLVNYNTLMRLASKVETKETERAEELRVLYVALTRAKEKFVTIATYKSSSNSKPKIVDLTYNDKIMPFCVLEASSSSDLILTAMLNHPDAHILRERFGVQDIKIIHNLPALAIYTADNPVFEREKQDEEQLKADTSDAFAAISERLGYVYPFAALDGIASKRVASDFAKAHGSHEFFATSLPAFMSKSELTPSQRGTATHKYMQFCSFENIDFDSQLSLMISNGQLTEQEAAAVDKEKIEKFFRNPIFNRIVSSQRVFREECFTCSVRSGEIYPELEGKAADELVIIDGIADIAFIENDGLVIVDYKTDHNVTADELRERYAGQLEIYARCLSDKVGVPTAATMIYSFSLGDTVEIQQYFVKK